MGGAWVKTARVHVHGTGTGIPVPGTRYARVFHSARKSALSRPRIIFSPIHSNHSMHFALVAVNIVKNTWLSTAYIIARWSSQS